MNIINLKKVRFQFGLSLKFSVAIINSTYSYVNIKINLQFKILDIFCS